MKIVLDVPEYIVDIINSGDKIGRRELADQADISEMEARFWLGCVNKKLGDEDPRSLGRQHILEEKVRYQTSRIKSLEKELATEQIVYDHLKDIAKAFPLVKPAFIQPKSGYEEREAIVIWSDWHGNEVVKANQIEGMNDYNINVMAGRIWNMIKGIKYIIQAEQSAYDISVLNLDLLGDFVSGNIHDELKETNELPNLTSCYTIAHIASQAVKILLDNFSHIRIKGVCGNHGRTEKKPQFKNKALNNYDTLIYQLMSGFLHNYIDEGLIDMDIPHSPECTTVRMGYAFLLSHSDHIRGWSGIPFYGFQRDAANQQKIRKLRSVLSENEWKPAEDLDGAIINMKDCRTVSGYDYRECGHWHQFNVIDDWTTIMNGCLIGTNEFSLHKLHATSAPKQAIAFLSRKWGLKGVEPIHCIDKGHNFAIIPEGTIADMMRNL